MDEFIRLLETVFEVFEFGQSPQAFLVLVGLAFARLLAFLVVVPFFGGAAVPARVKVATATAFVVILYPSLEAGLPKDVPLGFGPVGFIALLAKEALVGFTLGFVASLVFEAVQVSGRIIDFQRGSTIAEMFAPQLQTRGFEFVPATTFPHFQAGWGPSARAVAVMTGGVFSVGIQLAAPAMIALLLTDLFFGIINRVAPQINVFFISLPVKMFVGLLVVLVALQLYQAVYIEQFKEAYKAFQWVIRTLATTR
jgi:flagellar biosynthetic protein FliR